LKINLNINNENQDCKTVYAGQGVLIGRRRVKEGY
jgi:hypothetical protein